MVQESDLRIGNWYMADATGLTKEKPCCFLNWVEAGNFLYDCSPIPLTPEILEWCGFKNDNDGCPTLYYKHQKFQFSNSKLLYRQLPVADWNIFKCEYLHQLQTFYYLFTEEELI